MIVNDWSGHTFPHPPGRRPLIGDVAGADRTRPLQSTMGRSRGLGPMFELKVFSTKFVFVTGAEVAAELCDESRFRKGLPPALEALRDFAGDGLFTAYNDETNWQLAHDLLLPAFTKSAMQGYHPIMLEATRELFAYWEAKAVGPDTAGITADISRDMTKLTMETISRAAFSHDFGSFTSPEVHPFVPAMIAALTTGQRKGTLKTMPFAKRMVRRLNEKNAHHLEYVESMLDELIAVRRASGDTGQGDLLGIMLNQAHPETGERLDDVNIRHQILTFLVAGHETTSGALSFALYYLSRDPDLLAKAQQETDQILGDDPDAEPTFEQVAKFRYLRRALDEGLRLWPTAPAFGRSPRETTTLSNGVVMRPEDWAIVMLPMVHRDPEAWGDDAEAFDPDRFLPARSRGRQPHSYKPFGTGERACIGRQFALHEAVLVLARLLHRYDVAGDPAYDLVVSERLTLQPEGFELTLTPRTPGSVATGSETLVGLERRRVPAE
ncbi:MAG: cytochrome [Marmoricola sp.]|nr:cytochrome [Marmoricola sp.]